MPTSKPTNTEEYIASFPPDIRKVLQEVRVTIKKAAPEATESFKYAIPTFEQHGNLVHFAAFKNHLSLVVVSKSIAETFAKELAPFKSSGRTIHFTPEKPIPAALVKKIVKERVRENGESKKQEVRSKK